MDKNSYTVVDHFDDIEFYQRLAFLDKIAAKAMQVEKEKNRKLGIPSVFMRDGKILYELADGTITDQAPWDDLK